MRRFQDQNFAPKHRLLVSIKTSFDSRPDSIGQFNEAKLIWNVRDVIAHVYKLMVLMLNVCYVQRNVGWLS